VNAHQGGAGRQFIRMKMLRENIWILGAPMEIQTKLEKLVSYVSNHIHWSALGIFGNSFFGKLVMLAPFIAQAVRYSSEFFVDQLGLTNVLWLYWSLMFVSIGQVLYMWQCPAEIKKYGKDVTLYKIESLQSLHEYGFSVIHNQWLKTWFSNANHIKGFELPLNDNIKQLELPNFTSRKAAEDHARLAIEKSTRTEEKIPVEKLTDTYWCFCKNVTDYFCHPNIDWDAVNFLYNNHIGLFGVKQGVGYSPVLPITSRIVDGDDTHWKTEALSWFISKQDSSKNNIRLIIAVFYFLGSLYFIWHIPKNIANMAAFTFRALF